MVTMLIINLTFLEDIVVGNDYTPLDSYEILVPKMKSLIILGRQPAIGIAELESLYGEDNLQRTSLNTVMLKNDPSSINFSRLGGALKLGNIIGEINNNNLQNGLTNLVSKIELPTNSKITLGLSAYDIKTSAKYLQSLALTLKKSIRLKGVNVRVVPNREISLNTAQVLHNKLASNQGIELLLVAFGKKIIVARTTNVQDITNYASRDQMRPKRDSRVGMLPPKLAQIIINLASANTETKDKYVLDPFCGTGVLLQEALLMGYNVIATDIDSRMVEYSNINIEWLKQRWNNIYGSINISIGDARTHEWNQKIDYVASETFLGEPLTSIPSEEHLQKIISEVDAIHKDFLKNIHTQLLPNTRICLAIPAWHIKGRFLHLPILDQLAILGYNRVAFKHVDSQELIYHRPDQLVARELVTLTRK